MIIIQRKSPTFLGAVRCVFSTSRSFTLSFRCDILTSRGIIASLHEQLRHSLYRGVNGLSNWLRFHLAVSTMNRSQHSRERMKTDWNHLQKLAASVQVCFQVSGRLEANIKSTSASLFNASNYGNGCASSKSVFFFNCKRIGSMRSNNQC